MQLIVVRHGAAEATASSDAERALTAHGVAQARSLGRCLAGQLKDTTERKGLSMKCSPYRRAQQTAQTLCDAVAMTMPQSFSPELQPDSGPQQALSLCQDQSEALIIVSHQPLVGRLLNHLVYEDDLPFFDTACAAILEYEVDGLTERGSMRLNHFFRPEA